MPDHQVEGLFLGGCRMIRIEFPSSIELIQVLEVCLFCPDLGDSMGIGRVRQTEKEERDLEKAVISCLKEAAEREGLTSIAERLDRKWTDVDSPAGEYSSSSSPWKMVA